MVRSTWDYQDRHAEFLDWARRVAAVTTLANSAEVLAWNTDKTYLRTLQQAGLPVVPTDWLDPGDAFVVPEVGEYVVKPAVSAGSRDTNRYRAGDHDELAVAHATALLAAGRTVMVQPYLAKVDTHGETAMFFFGGVFSHAVRKGPLLTPAMELVSGAYKPETIEPRDPSEAEREAAEQVLDALAQVSPATPRAAALRPGRPGARSRRQPRCCSSWSSPSRRCSWCTTAAAAPSRRNGSRPPSRRR